MRNVQPNIFKNSDCFRQKSIARWKWRNIFLKMVGCFQTPRNPSYRFWFLNAHRIPTWRACKMQHLQRACRGQVGYSKLAVVHPLILLAHPVLLWCMLWGVKVVIAPSWMLFFSFYSKILQSLLRKKICWQGTCTWLDALKKLMERESREDKKRIEPKNLI